MLMNDSETGECLVLSTFNTIRDGLLEKLWGGIFELQEFFFRHQITCMNFLGHSMNIF